MRFTCILTLTILFAGNFLSAQDTKLFEQVTYFPLSVYREAGDKIDSLKFIAYSRMLKAFDEPKLITSPDSNTRVYRFTWTRSFHKKMIVRLVVSPSRGTMIIKTDEPDPGTTSAYKVDSIQVGQATINQFNSLIEATGFWKMQNEQASHAIHDGAGWLLEAQYSANGYHMVYKHSPTPERDFKFRSICLFLVGLIKDAEKPDID